MLECGKCNTYMYAIKAGVYTKTFSVKNEYFVFVFVYMEAMRCLHQYLSTKTLHDIVITNEYLHEFHVTTIHVHRVETCYC